MPCPLAALISATAAFAGAGFPAYFTTTANRSLASRFAIEPPIPPEAPVTIALFVAEVVIGKPCSVLAFVHAPARSVTSNNLPHLLFHALLELQTCAQANEELCAQ